MISMILQLQTYNFFKKFQCMHALDVAIVGAHSSYAYDSYPTL